MAGHHELAAFVKMCRDAGVKATHQRTEILRELAATDEHPDAETIYQRVRKRLPTVSLDTVYRTLWLLVDLGLITTQAPGRRRTRFDANLDQHHHFICSNCGFTRDFYSDRLNDLNLPDCIAELGAPQQTQVEVHGLCHACRAEEKKQPTGV